MEPITKHCEKEYYENGNIRTETYTTDEEGSRREHTIGYNLDGSVEYQELYINGEFRQLI